MAQAEKKESDADCIVDYICPITKNLVDEPVYIDNDPKQWFEKSAISTWFEENDTNPRTGLKVTSKQLTDYPELKNKQQIFMKRLFEERAFMEYQKNEKNFDELEILLKHSNKNEFRRKFASRALDYATRSISSASSVSFGSSGSSRSSEPIFESPNAVRRHNDLEYEKLQEALKIAFEEASDSGYKVTKEDTNFCLKVINWVAANKKVCAIVATSGVLGGAMGAAVFSSFDSIPATFVPIAIGGTAFVAALLAGWVAYKMTKRSTTQSLPEGSRQIESN